MALTEQQIKELNIAQQRVDAGGTDPADLKNLEYARRTFGFVPTRAVSTDAGPSATPTTERQNLEGQGYKYLGTMDQVRQAITQYGADRVKKMENGYYILPGAEQGREQAERLGYQYLGTMDQVNDAIRKYGKERVQTIGGNYYVLPKSVAQGGISPTSSIPAGALGGGMQALNDILGANLPAGFVNSDIAGLLSLYEADTKSQQQLEGFQGQLIDEMRKLGGEGADLQAALDKQGVGAAFEQVKSLNLKAAQLKGELEQFDAQTLQDQSNIENQTIPTGLIVGQQAQLEKQRNLARIAKAAELSGTIALSQAYQGNAQLGMQLAQQAVDLKYAPIRNEIDVLKTQIGFASEKLSRDDQKRSQIIGALLDVKMDEISQQHETESKIQSLAIEAAANGAPLSVIEAMKAAGDPATAASIGGQFIRGDLESLLGADGSTPATTGFINSKVEQSVREDAVALLDQVQAGAMTVDQAYERLRKLYSTTEVTDDALRSLLGSGFTTPSVQGEVTGGSSGGLITGLTTTQKLDRIKTGQTGIQQLIGRAADSKFISGIADSKFISGIADFLFK